MKNSDPRRPPRNLYKLKEIIATFAALLWVSFGDVFPIYGLNIFYPRTQIGFHVEPDAHIRQSMCFTFKLSTYKNSPVDSIAINSLFNDATIENITTTTTM